METIYYLTHLTMLASASGIVYFGLYKESKLEKGGVPETLKIKIPYDPGLAEPAT